MVRLLARTILKRPQCLDSKQRVRIGRPWRDRTISTSLFIGKYPLNLSLLNDWCTNQSPSSNWSESVSSSWKLVPIAGSSRHTTQWRVGSAVRLLCKSTSRAAFPEKFLWRFTSRFWIIIQIIIWWIIFDEYFNWHYISISLFKFWTSESQLVSQEQPSNAPKFLSALNFLFSMFIYLYFLKESFMKVCLK